jgi:thiol-disulfide isomerase/thioredoxin
MFQRFCAILLFMLTVTDAAARADDFAAHFIAVNPPTPMPLFSFEDVSGHMLGLKDFQGRYVLLNLWATWCGPCAHELPSLDALQELALEHFTVIALTEDVNGRDAAQAFYERHGIRHLAVYVDVSGRAPALLQARGLPTSFLIDPEGREIGAIEGEADWSAPDIVAFLKTQMKP